MFAVSATALRMATADLPTYAERIDRATWMALAALGDLTRLATDARTTTDANYAAVQANALIQAALGALGVARDKQDSL